MVVHRMAPALMAPASARVAGQAPRARRLISVQILTVASMDLALVDNAPVSAAGLGLAARLSRIQAHVISFRNLLGAQSTTRQQFASTLSQGAVTTMRSCFKQTPHRWCRFAT